MSEEEGLVGELIICMRMGLFGEERMNDIG